MDLFALVLATFFNLLINRYVWKQSLEKSAALSLISLALYLLGYWVLKA